MKTTPELTGNGVRLVPMALSHVDALSRIALDPSIWRFMTVRVNSPQDVAAWVQASLTDAERGTVQPWVIFVDDEAVGSTRFLDLQPAHRTAEIGFTWLAQPWRSSGVNPRVKLLQLTYGFERLMLRRIALKTHHDNLHSQNAMLKLGAQYEGTFRNHMIMPDGSTRHTKWYSMTAEEWPKIRTQLQERIAREPLCRQGAPLQ